MTGQFVVNVPSSFMYLEKNGNDEVTDELLYGTKVRVLEENPKGRALCITEYGYKGYLDTASLAPFKAENTYCLAVTSSFCPLYAYKQARCPPEKVLMRGSRVYCDNVREIDGYLSLEIDGRQFFAGKAQLSDTKKLFTFTSAQEKRRQIVKNALSYLGTPYVWAGKSPEGIDCSGLCFMAYSMAGISLYRDAEPDARYVKKINRENLKMGDLVYFNGHVVMYIGDNLYIHSSSAFSCVTVNSFDKSSSLYYETLDKKEVCCASGIVLSDV